MNPSVVARAVTRALVVCLVVMLAACGETANGRGVAQDADTTNGETKASDDRLRLVFLGDSLTAGYGVDPLDAYPALLEARIDARGWPVEVVNAGLSGDTTAAGLRRLDWIQREPIDVLVLALGANDGLRGIPTDETRRNLEAIVARAEQGSPGVRVVLAGMKAVPNMGMEFGERFGEIFPELSDALDLPLIPFLLEGVGGVPAMNQSDRIHPNEDGHEVVADVVWDVLEDVLAEAVAEAGRG